MTDYDLYESRHPNTVAIQRTIAHCKEFIKDREELRYSCAFCLDRVLKEDY
jgi:hypothetical protein